jgi:hypothetical protein
MHGMRHLNITHDLAPCRFQESALTSALCCYSRQIAAGACWLLLCRNNQQTAIVRGLADLTDSWDQTGCS